MHSAKSILDINSTVSPSNRGRINRIIYSFSTSSSIWKDLLCIHRAIVFVWLRAVATAASAAVWFRLVCEKRSAHESFKRSGILLFTKWTALFVVVAIDDDQLVANTLEHYISSLFVPSCVANFSSKRVWWRARVPFFYGLNRILIYILYLNEMFVGRLTAHSDRLNVQRFIWDVCIWIVVDALAMVVVFASAYSNLIYSHNTWIVFRFA